MQNEDQKQRNHLLLQEEGCAFPLEGKTVQATSFLHELCITGELTVQTNGEQQKWGL